VSLRLRLLLAKNDLDHWIEKRLVGLFRHAPRWFLRRALVELAVRATAEDLIGPHAYAGPDGVDYERMWWALEGKLPPRRAEAIRAPVG
jgi:hypothetical protein